MAEKKLDYEFVTEDVWGADTAISQSNPLGKVPCLVMEGGEALFDSRVIVEYLDTLSPVGKLIPPVGPRTGRGQDLGGAGRRRARRADPGAARSQLERPPKGRAQPGLDRPPTGQDAGQPKAMSQGLGDKPYCAGIYLSLADIAVGCALGYLDFRFPEIDWRSRYPNLAKLQDKLMQRAELHRQPAGLRPQAAARRLSQRIRPPTAGSFSYSSSAASQ